MLLEVDTDWIDPISNGFQVAASNTGISNNLNLSGAETFPVHETLLKQ